MARCAEARRLATEDRDKIQLGVDVAVEKQRAKLEAAGAWAVKRLAEDCLAKSEGRLEQSTIEGQKQRLRDYIYPAIGNVNTCEVCPSDLIAIVERASKKSLHVARLVLGGRKSDIYSVLLVEVWHIHAVDGDKRSDLTAYW